MNERTSIWSSIASSWRSTKPVQRDDYFEPEYEDEYIEPESSGEGHLSVDVFETDSHVIVQAFMAGVHHEDIELNLARNRISIRAFRQNPFDDQDCQHVYQELFWGSFSREVELPEEVDIDRAEAAEDHGLLTIKLPKIDKERVSRVRILRQ